MRKTTFAVIAGLVALSLAVFTVNLLAGPGCDAKAKGSKSCALATSAGGDKGCPLAGGAASTGGKGCPMAAAAAGGKSCPMAGGSAGGSMCATGHMMGSACAAKSAMAALVKEAPGTKAEFVSVGNGISMVVTAGSAGDVATVQSVMAREIEKQKSMKPGTAGACSHAGAAAGTGKAAAPSCAGMKGEAGAGVEKAGMKTCAGMDTKAAGCTAGACPEWMCTLCCAKVDVSNTPGGVTLTWTTDKADKVDALRKAGQQFQEAMSKL